MYKHQSSKFWILSPGTILEIGKQRVNLIRFGTSSYMADWTYILPWQCCFLCNSGIYRRSTA
ncbi:unnamed protein product, partial [Allacma fusca]